MGGRQADSNPKIPVAAIGVYDTFKLVTRQCLQQCCMQCVQQRPTSSKILLHVKLIRDVPACDFLTLTRTLARQQDALLIVSKGENDPRHHGNYNDRREAMIHQMSRQSSQSKFLTGYKHAMMSRLPPNMGYSHSYSSSNPRQPLYILLDRKDHNILAPGCFFLRSLPPGIMTDFAWNDATSKCYHASITLNNTAVHLLGKGAVLQAHQTFSDGVTVLKGVIYSERTNVNVDAMVHRAVRRRLNCKPDCKSLLVSKMEVLVCNLSMPPCTRFLHSIFNACTDSRTPIHIDLFDSHMSGSTASIVLSILLHNAAITSFLLSQMHPSGSRYQRHMNNAVKFCNFSIRLALQDDPNYRPCVGAQACGLTIAFHAAKSMVQVIQLSPRTASSHDMRRYQHLLCEIRARVNHFQDTPILALFSQANFAAAA